jgi:hypothetical protein
MGRWLVLIIGWGIAFLILKYRRPVKEFIGDVSFAERVFGAGGTNTLIVIIGFLTWLFSLMYALGTLQVILKSLASPFFGST